MDKADNLFYTPNIEDQATSFTLPEEESQHAIKVLRMEANEKIHLVDGRGGLYEVRIKTPHPKRCEVEVIDRELLYGKRDFKLHIAIAPTKMNERMEWFLEKCTEIGINEITPLLCQRSERKELKTQRMMKIIVSAMKQSVKAYCPILNEMTPIKQLIDNATETQKYIAHCINGEKTLLKTICQPKTDTLILIGPEGDFSEEEVKYAIEKGFLPISLGSSRLRTETAGIVACHTVNLINEE